MLYYSRSSAVPASWLEAYDPTLYHMQQASLSADPMLHLMPDIQHDNLPDICELVFPVCSGK